MPMKSVFAGYHKISGERVLKVFNPVGLFSAFVVENGSGPYAGSTVLAGDIVQEEPVSRMPDTPELQDSVRVMQDANEKLLDD